MMPGLQSGNASVTGLMPDLLALPFLICAVVACIAGMVRGFAGFGAAMIMTPIFSALYAPAVGVSSGFVSGVAGMAGPPIAFYYLAGDDAAARVRANLTTYFVFVDLVAIATFASRDLVGWNTVVLALFLAPAVMLGGVIGA